MCSRSESSMRCPGWAAFCATVWLLVLEEVLLEEEDEDELLEEDSEPSDGAASSTRSSAAGRIGGWGGFLVALSACSMIPVAMLSCSIGVGPLSGGAAAGATASAIFALLFSLPGSTSGAAAAGALLLLPSPPSALRLFAGGSPPPSMSSPVPSCLSLFGTSEISIFPVLSPACSAFIHENFSVAYATRPRFLLPVGEDRFGERDRRTPP
mmetsp:Transcript_2195/g.5153  ORF Transcript_2195/g.5153 Transcript_2195/m.5153 type:complete len:210 (-) Transcript_2195:775-1404(-)